MPAFYGNRRLESGTIEVGGLSPPDAYNPNVRYAISLLGIVVSIVVLPLGVQPTLQLGQVATVSSTLQIGDAV